MITDLAMHGHLEGFLKERDIPMSRLTDRVEDAREAQTEAKEQFSDALERYRAVINIDGGDLEKVYDRLNASLERSEARAQTVRTRVDQIESVGDDLCDHRSMALPLRRRRRPHGDPALR